VEATVTGGGPKRKLEAYAPALGERPSWLLFQFKTQAYVPVTTKLGGGPGHKLIFRLTSKAPRNTVSAAIHPKLMLYV
jgi:hypothetical protein